MKASQIWRRLARRQTASSVNINSRQKASDARYDWSRSPRKATDKNFEGANLKLFMGRGKKKEKSSTWIQADIQFCEREERVLMNYLTDHEQILLKEKKRIFS